MDNKSLRKALEVPLFDAMAAANPIVLVDWENQGFDTNQLHPVTHVPITEYVRCRHYPNPAQAMTLGATPRIQVGGFSKTDVFVQSGAGRDRADAIAALIEAAYPITTTLLRNGIQVQIGVVTVSAGLPWSNWWYTPINISWTVWSDS